MKNGQQQNLSFDTDPRDEGSAPLRELQRVVIGLAPNGSPILEVRTVESLLEVLRHRARRLVGDPETRRRLTPVLHEFVRNIVTHFTEAGELDDYVLVNIMTALAMGDLHRQRRHGIEDCSTLIRKLNPTDPASDDYFVIGREGRIGDPGCPLSLSGDLHGDAAGLPRQQRLMVRAYHHARSQDPGRGAPRIPVASFRRLVPRAVMADQRLEEAFLDVCFSDGAWDLYQRKMAA